MSASSSVNITELIDRYPLGLSQIKIIALCGLVALLDGFDLLAIGVAASAMAGPLHIASRQFGFIFSQIRSGFLAFKALLSIPQKRNSVRRSKQLDRQSQHCRGLRGTMRMFPQPM